MPRPLLLAAGAAVCAVLLIVPARAAADRPLPQHVPVAPAALEGSASLWSAPRGSAPTGSAPAESASAAVNPADDAAGGSSTGQARWSWPLVPRPRVVRRFDNPAQPWLPGHRGADLAAAPGAVILAPADGVVAFAGMVAGRPVLSIDHAGGLRSTYESVTTELVAGTPVRRGQPLAVLVANIECPPASCLHWGARRGETYVDPVRLITGGPPILLPIR